MKEISFKEFCMAQPSFPEVEETDAYYHNLANSLAAVISDTPFGQEMPEALVSRIALNLTGYMQDIVADAGLWRSFVTANRSLYGFSLPFFPVSESYVDFELNREDIRFLVWYNIAMLWEVNRLIFPYDNRLLEVADKCFELLESKYEEAPVPEKYNIARGLEFNDPDDRSRIYHLGNWLFLHSYLLVPAFALSLQELAAGIPADDPDYYAKLNKALEEAMMNDTTGPLALFVPEWVYLMIEGRLPAEPQPKAGEVHKYYDAFVRYTGGKEIMYFDSYEKMNDFFIKALGWAEGEQHLAQAKGRHDYVLMVNRQKGMLMAADVARCIKSPDNPLYNQDYAKIHAVELLTDRGRCPGDLLKTVLKNGWLPDARFPDASDFVLSPENADFMARAFLQIYYRGD